jgi:RHS repeat-associated protein
VDDLNPTGYAQVTEELVSGAVQREYTYGLQRINENQVISGAWTPSFYGYDGFGSVRQLTNTAGVVTDTYEYDAFGNRVSSTGTTPNNYLYRGEQYDADLGLYYLRARYYNSLTGRFLSRDPLGGKAVDPKTLHKYLYADGDPVNSMDPTGRGVTLETVLLNAQLIAVVGYQRIQSMNGYEIIQAVGALSCVLSTAEGVLDAAGNLLWDITKGEHGEEPGTPDLPHQPLSPLGVVCEGSQ